MAIGMMEDGVEARSTDREFINTATVSDMKEVLTLDSSLGNVQLFFLIKVFFKAYGNNPVFKVMAK